MQGSVIYFLWALHKVERSPESEGNSLEFVHWQRTQAALGGTTGAGVGIGLGTGIAVGQPLIGLALGLAGGLGLGMVMRRRAIGD